MVSDDLRFYVGIKKKAAKSVFIKKYAGIRQRRYRNGFAYSTAITGEVMRAWPR
jgi:hypothetical protein